MQRTIVRRNNHDRKTKVQGRGCGTFTLGKKEITGKVFVVDKYGIFCDHSDVYYDIKDEKANMLYKHVEEKFVRKEERK